MMRNGMTPSESIFANLNRSLQLRSERMTAGSVTIGESLMLIAAAIARPAVPGLPLSRQYAVRSVKKAQMLSVLPWKELLRKAARFQLIAAAASQPQSESPLRFRQI